MAKAKKIKSPESLFTEFLSQDWKYSGAVEHSYQSEYDCDSYGCDSICRCGKIIDVKLSEVNIEVIIEEVLKKSTDLILTYCLDRILRREFYSADSSIFEAQTCRGYYGEELEYIKLDSAIAKNLENKIKGLVSLTTERDRIYYVLENEYGYLLPSIQAATKWSVETVSLDEISIGQEDHYRKLNKEVVKNYKGCRLPRAVCLKDGPKFKLLDGYHRIAAAKSEKEYRVSIVVGACE